LKGTPDVGGQDAMDRPASKAAGHPVKRSNGNIGAKTPSRVNDGWPKMPPHMWGAANERVLK